MILDTLKFAGKLALVFIVVSFFTVMGLTLILGLDISPALRIAAGAIFIVFQLGMVWDNCTRWGERDCRAVITYVRNRGTKEQLAEAKKQLYYPLKGFIAGAIVMLIPLVLTVIYNFMAYRGWENGMGNTADMIYTVLFLIFTAYSPLLVTATTVCTTMAAMPGMSPIVALGVTQDIPVMGGFSNLNTGNMVLPFMFFIPIVVFVIVCGVCYMMGFKKRATEIPQHMQDVYFPKDNKFKPMEHVQEAVTEPAEQVNQAAAEPAQQMQEPEVQQSDAEADK